MGRSDRARIEPCWPRVAHTLAALDLRCLALVRWPGNDTEALIHAWHRRYRMRERVEACCDRTDVVGCAPHTLRTVLHESGGSDANTRAS